MTVDVGGTKTLVAGFDENGKMSHESRFATPSDPNLFINELHAHLQGISSPTIDAVGIGVPGAVDNDGTVIYCSNLQWRNFALRTILSREYTCPIFVKNDAKLGGLGETHALPNLPALSLYITVGTGIGSGITIRGELEPALERSEAGKIILLTESGWRTWESFASGHAIAMRFGHLASEITDPHDWQIIAEALAPGLAVLIPALQPDVVIIGGGIGTHFDHYGAELKKLLSERLSDIVLPSIQKAVHPEEAVIYGAYYYAHQIIR